MVIILSPKMYHFGDDIYSIIKARIRIVPNRTAREFIHIAKKYRKILLDVIVPHYILHEVLLVTKTHVLFL